MKSLDVLKQCSICGIGTYAIIAHHISYKPEVTIDICSNCHFLIHHPPLQLEKLALLPEKLQYYILLNQKRSEREEQFKVQTDKIRVRILWNGVFEYLRYLEKNPNQPKNIREFLPEGFYMDDIVYDFEKDDPKFMAKSYALAVRETRTHALVPYREALKT